MRKNLIEFLDRPATRHAAGGRTWSRIVPVFFVFVTVMIVAALTVFGWAPTWNFIGVPTMTPHFADMRTVQGGLESLSYGLNPQIENPGDPWGRRMNYPSVWLDLAAFLQFDIELNFTASVTAFLALAALSILYLNTRFASVWMLLVSLSSAILLGFERGNNDLLVFTLVTFACFAPRGVALGLVIISGMLKIFPLVAGAIFLDSWRRFAVFFVAATVSVAILLPELGQIRAGVPQSAWLSYGSNSLSSAAERTRFGLFTPPLIFSAFLVMVSAALYFLVERPQVPSSVVPFSLEQRLYLAGGSIFIGTFLISSNFDYRLVFLILCVPYLVARRGLLRQITLVCVLASANWLLMARLGTLGIYANLVCKTVLFVCILYYFLKIIRPIVLNRLVW